MIEFLKKFSTNVYCNTDAMCSLHPGINALYELIINEIREISFYFVKLKEFNITNNSIMDLCIKALSIFIVNTNFNKNDYINILNELYLSKIEVKDKYLDYCSQYKIPCETINSDFIINKNIDIYYLIEYSQNNIKQKQKNYDKTKQNLFDLITFSTKLTAVNLVKIKKFLPDFNEYDYEILRFFALTNGYSIRTEKIKRRILEFLDISKKIHDKLNSIYEQNFGKIENTTINKSLKEGYSILVSGDDLYDLQNLLKTIETNFPNEKINVYTHGELLKAHFYPYFKNNKFLKGHLGSNKIEYDFSIFNGIILITQNFVQKIDTIYKGDIFSNKIISFEKMARIENDNYVPLIEKALDIKYFQEINNKASSFVDYNIKDVKNELINFNYNESVCVIGGGEYKFLINNYENKKIIMINGPFILELLEILIDNFNKKNIKYSIFFANCNLYSFSILLHLLNKNLDLYLANCSSIYINPHITEALREEFNVKLV